MASDGVTSFFRAIADFSRLRSEARSAARDLDNMGRSSDRAGEKVGKTEQSSDKAGNAFTRLGAKLGDAHRKLDNFSKSDAGRALDKIAGAAGNVLGALGRLGAGIGVMALIGTSAMAAVGPIMSLIGAIGALSGVMGVLPALGAGFAAAVGTVAIGLGGLKEAFGALGKAQGGAGAGAGASAAQQKAAAKAIRSATDQVAQAKENLKRTEEDAARSIAAAERRVADAEKNVTKAQKDALKAQLELTKARKDAKEQAEDLALAVAGGALDEQQAVLDVADAQKELARVQADPSSTAEDRQRALLNYQQQVQSLEELRLSNKRLAAEKAESDAKGIEGSDQVVAAQERVADANEGVADAQQGVKDAQEELARAHVEASRQIADATHGVEQAQQALADALEKTDTAAGGAASALDQAMANLSPKAQELVRAVQALMPAWKQLKFAVQDALLDGAGKAVTELSDRYLPILKRGMVGIADGFNSMMKRAVAFFKESQTMKDVDGLLTNTSTSTHILAGAFDNVLHILRDFVGVGSDFLPGIAQGVTNITEKWRDFIAKARESGKLKEWIQVGLDQLKALGGVVKNVGSIIFSVFKASSAAGAGFFKTLENLTGKLADFLKSAEGQQALRNIFDAAKRAIDILLPVVKALGGLLMTVLPILIDIAERVGPGVAKVINALKVAFETAKPGLEKLADAVGGFLDALGDAGPLVGALANGISDVLSPVIDALTWLLKTLLGIFNSLPKPVQDLIGDFGGLVLAAGLALLGFKKIIDITKTFTGAFKSVSGAIGSAIDKLKDWLAKSKEAKAADLGTDFLSGGGVDGKKNSGLGKAVGAVGIAGAATLGARAVQDAAGLNDTGNAGKANLDDATKGNLSTATHGVVGEGTIDPKKLVEFSDWLDNLGEKLSGFGDTLKQPFLDFSLWLSGTALPAIKQPFLDFSVWLSERWTDISGGISEAWNAIGDFFSSLWDGIVLTAEEKWQGLTDWWNGLWTSISEGWNSFWGGIGDFFSGLWTWISTTAQTAWQGLSDWWDGLWAGIGEKWNAFWGGIADWFSSLWTNISAGVQNAWNAIGDWLKQRWTDITDWLKRTWEDIKNFAVSTWNNITSGISSAVSSVGDWIKNRWNDITGWLKGLWDGIKAKAQQIWDAISGAITGGISKAGDVLSGIWNNITTGVHDAWENIKRIVGDAVDWVKQRISDIGSGLSNAASWVGGLVGIGRNEGGWVPGNVAGPNKDSVPLLATPGEFVVKRGPAQAHKRELEALNNGGPMLPTMTSSASDLVNNAAGMSSLEGALAASTRAVPAAGMRPSVPAGGDGVSIGSISLTQIVQNPLPEKPSVSLSRHTGTLAKHGLQAAMRTGRP